MSQMKLLVGKTAIITGAGRGIGAEIAFLLGVNGANLVICSRNMPELEKVASKIRRRGGKVFTIKADVSKQKDVKRMFKIAIKKYSNIDFLVNNAGIGEKLAPLEQWIEPEIDRVIKVNLLGPLYCCNLLIKMQKDKPFKIINIVSKAGVRGYANMVAYSSSKFGLIGLTKSLAKELKKGKVYAICPGRVNTALYRKFFKLDNLVLPPKRIAEKVLELCKNNCRIKSGSVIKVFS